MVVVASRASESLSKTIEPHAEIGSFPSIPNVSLVIFALDSSLFSGISVPQHHNPDHASALRARLALQTSTISSKAVDPLGDGLRMWTGFVRTICAVIGASPSNVFETSTEASPTASLERTCLFLVTAASLVTVVVARVTFSLTATVSSTQVVASTWNDPVETQSSAQHVVILTAFWNPAGQEIACQRTSSVVSGASREHASMENAPFSAIAFSRANGVAGTRACLNENVSTHPSSTVTASSTANVFVNVVVSGCLSSCHSKHPCSSRETSSRFSPPRQPWPLTPSSFSHLPLRL
jgi:hypothetical protein